MQLADLHIDWQRKPIKRLHLRVYPDGRVVVSSPWLCSRHEVEQFVEKHLDWIRKTQERLNSPTNQPTNSLPAITREQAEELIAYLTERVEHWRGVMGEAPVTWKIRNMKTQWGNCRAATRRITFNLQLARVPNELRDYIIVHELAHLQVQNHSPRFYAHVARFIPDWQQRRKALRQFEK